MSKKESTPKLRIKRATVEKKRYKKQPYVVTLQGRASKDIEDRYTTERTAATGAVRGFRDFLEKDPCSGIVKISLPGGREREGLLDGRSPSKIILRPITKVKAKK